MPPYFVVFPEQTPPGHPHMESISSPLHRTTPRSGLISRLALPLVMLLAVVVRVSGIEIHNLWADEAFSYYETTLSVQTIVEYATSEASHPPLYCLTLKGWSMLFGNSPAALRMLSALLNCLTIWLLYLILSRHSQPVALMTAFLLSIAPSQIHFSHEVRMYSMLALWCSLAVFGYLRSWEKNFASLKYNIIAVVSMTLAFYTHMLGAFIPVSLLFHSVVIVRSRIRHGHPETRRTIRNLILIYGSTFILYLPWFTMMYLTRDGLVAGQGWRPTLTMVGVGVEIGKFLGTSMIGSFIDVVELQYHVYGLLMALGVIVTFTTLIRGIRYKQLPTHIRVMLLVSPLIAILLILYTKRSFELLRYFFFVTPFLFATIAYGIVAIPRTSRAVLVYALIVFTQTAGLISYYSIASRDSDHRPAIEVIQNRMRPEDKLLVLPSDIDKVYMYYLRDDVRLVDLIRNWDEAVPAPGPQQVNPDVLWIAIDYRSRWFYVPADAVVAADPAYVVREEWKFPEGRSNVRLLRAEKRETAHSAH